MALFVLEMAHPMASNQDKLSSHAKYKGPDMRTFIVLTGLALGLSTSVAKADEEVCFINNSSIDIGISLNGDTEFTDMPAKSGDKGVCASVSAANGNELDAEAFMDPTSYRSFFSSLDSQISNWIIFTAPDSFGPAATIINAEFLASVSISFYNPQIGAGDFYYNNPWSGQIQTIPYAEKLKWPPSTLLCNTVRNTCQYWSRGDDGVFRVIYQDYMVEVPNEALSPTYEG